MGYEEQISILLNQGVNAWNEWRKLNPAVDVDLATADLRDADLTGANFKGANFSGAYLWNTNLSETDLSGAHLAADLTDANLTGAHLYDTHFYGAYLNGTHLNETRLIGTIFRKADLENADITGATCGGIIFADTNLSNVKGLETVRHLGPSTIGIDTLFQTKPRLPGAFLRGCGVPEIMISYMSSLLEKPFEFFSCFISYNHEDKAFARRVYDTLQGRGIRCWLDEKQINPGDVIEDEISSAIRYSDKLLLCGSRNSLNSWWVDNELDNLFAKERKLQSDRGQSYRLLIPLDLDGYLHSDEYTSGKKEQIRKRFAPSFKDWEHDNAIFEREIDRVIKALRTDGGKEPPPKSKLY